MRALQVFVDAMCNCIGIKRKLEEHIVGVVLRVAVKESGHVAILETENHRHDLADRRPRSPPDSAQLLADEGMTGFQLVMKLSCPPCSCMDSEYLRRSRETQQTFKLITVHKPHVPL